MTAHDLIHTSRWELEEKLVLDGMKNGMDLGSIADRHARRIG